MPQARRNGSSVDLDDDEDDLPSTYGKGDIGKILKPGLIELIEHRAQDGKKKHLSGFVNWVPPGALEDFLMLAVEYAADKVMPQGAKGGSRKTARKQASQV